MQFNDLIDRLQHLTKNQFYWVLQCLGWTVYAIVPMGDNAFFNYEDSTSFSLVVFCYTIFGITGMGFSILIRIIYQYFQRYSFVVLLPIAVLCCIFFSLIWTFLKKAFIWYVAFPETYGQWSSGEIPFAAIFYHFSSSFMVFSIWSAFYFGINYYLKFVEQTKKTLAIEADFQRSRLELLRYQLNPHFLFNSLNAASNLALRGDGEQTSDMLAKLSTFLRYSLDNSPSEKVTLQQDINVMKEYLEIERIRFGQRLRVDWCLSPDTLNFLVPSFLIQPLIENVIKHALVKNKETTVLSVHTMIQHNYLVLRIMDNGALTSLEPINSKQGIGLQNIRTRLELFYDKNYELNMYINQPHGLVVEIKLPMNM